MPSSPSAPPDLPLDRPFAHRGLHGSDTGTGVIVENSRAAFTAAIAGGYGIELDVQASRDGVPMVFHDATLDRLTADAGALATRDAAALGGIVLAGTTETIPTLAEILALIGGRAPVLIEIKRGGRVRALAQGVAALLDHYAGPAAAMSFDPRVGRWYRRHCPMRACGLVVTERDAPGWRGRIARWLAVRWSRPRFIACDVRDLPSAVSRHARRRGLPVLSWTVRTAEERRIVALHADQAIFER